MGGGLGSGAGRGGGLVVGDAHGGAGGHHARDVALDDQAVALRLVALTDRLYDAGIPVVASGAKLDTIFSAEMLEGGYRKKYLRATSRLLALSNPALSNPAAQPSA